MRIASFLLVLPLVLNSAATLFAWSESGHAIIMLLANDLLSPEEQAGLQELIQQHPNFGKDFQPPESLSDAKDRAQWVTGRIGYWPDVARAYDEYNRPTWHYQLGAALTMGDVSQIDVPADPGALPADATMETQELHVLQALELCTRTLANKKLDGSERAIALCWVAHLIADLHLPCHSGSLYAETVFAEPDGDRGANQIRVGESRLHGVWDRLLGNEYERGDINRRWNQIRTNPDLTARMETSTDVMDSSAWIDESRSIAVQFLYVGEIQQAVRSAIESKSTRLPPIVLSESYGKEAGRVARIRAAEAAARLAEVLRKAL
jgi:hypothetical protein